MRGRSRPRPARFPSRGAEEKGGGLTLCLGIPLALSGAAALLTMEGMRDRLAELPGFPAWAALLLWLGLALLLGFASCRIWNCRAPAERKEAALSLYAVLLALRFLWTLTFFGMEKPWLALLVLTLLLVLTVLALRQFHRLDRLSALLASPYVPWLCFWAWRNLVRAVGG